MAVTGLQLTLEEFLRLPSDEPPLEYEHGAVIQKVSPKTRHSRLQWLLADRINRVVEAPKFALAFPELRSTFGGHSYVPDLSVYRWDRIPVDAQGDPVDDLFIPPDVAIEIASPEQSVNFLVRRCIWYTEHGVRTALLVDPDDRSVLVVRSGETVHVLRGDDVIDLSEELLGFRLPVKELFGAMALR